MQNILKRRQFSAGLAAAAVPFITPRHAQAQIADGGTIVVGQSAVLSGVWKGVGEPLTAGVRLAFDEANTSRNAGLGQRKMELHTLNDGYNPQRAVDNTQRLINSGAFALMGYTGTAVCLAAGAVAVRAKIPFFAPFTGAREVRQPFNRWVFHVRAPYDTEVESMVNQLARLGLTRFALLHRGDAFGDAVAESVSTALAAHGMSLAAVGVQKESDTSEMETTVKNLLVAKPQAILQANTAALCASIVRAARQAGYGGMFYHLSITGAEALSAALGKNAEGVVVSQIVPSPYKETHILTREFLEASKKHGPVRPSYLSLEGYLSGRVFIEGVRNAIAQSGGKLTRDALVVGLESIKQRVADVSVAYSASNHQGSRFVEMSMLTGDGRVRV